MLTWSLGCTGVLEPSSPPRISIARLEMTYCSCVSDRHLKLIRTKAYLVGVHVTLCAAPSLKDDEREMINEFARDDLNRLFNRAR